MRNSLSFILIWILFVSCGQQAPSGQLQSGHFSLDSLIRHQVSHLVRLDPTLVKNALLSDSSENVILNLDSLEWEKELKVFRETNIDKPAFYGSYLFTEGKKDDFSNLLFDEYIAQDKEALIVEDLRIYYLKSKDVLKRVEIYLNDRNELFEYERELIMTFEDRSGNPILSNYTVRGSQKLKLNDRISYEVEGQLQF